MSSKTIDNETVLPQETKKMPVMVCDAIKELLLIVLIYAVILYFEKKPIPSVTSMAKFTSYVVVFLTVQFYVLNVDMFKILPSTAAAVVAAKTFGIMF